MATMIKRATVGGRVESFVDGRTLGGLVADGLASELDYLTADEAQAAHELELELVRDAAAGVDIRIRLIGRACS